MSGPSPRSSCDYARSGSPDDFATDVSEKFAQFKIETGLQQHGLHVYGPYSTLVFVNKETSADKFTKWVENDQYPTVNDLAGAASFRTIEARTSERVMRAALGKSAAGSQGSPVV